MNDLSAIYAEASGVAHDAASHDAGLRAVEAAVRAGQIEKDVALAATWAPSDWDGWLASETPHWVANAIRAQLEGTTDE